MYNKVPISRYPWAQKKCLLNVKDKRLQCLMPYGRLKLYAFCMAGPWVIVCLWNVWAFNMCPSVEVQGTAIIVSNHSVSSQLYISGFRGFIYGVVYHYIYMYLKISVGTFCCKNCINSSLTVSSIILQLILRLTKLMGKHQQNISSCYKKMGKIKEKRTKNNCTVADWSLIHVNVVITMKLSCTHLKVTKKVILIPCQGKNLTNINLTTR